LAGIDALELIADRIVWSEIGDRRAVMVSANRWRAERRGLVAGCGAPA
jgi:hypothetical protein